MGEYRTGTDYGPHGQEPKGSGCGLRLVAAAGLLPLALIVYVGAGFLPSPFMDLPPSYFRYSIGGLIIHSTFLVAAIMHRPGEKEWPEGVMIAGALIGLFGLFLYLPIMLLAINAYWLAGFFSNIGTALFWGGYLASSVRLGIYNSGTPSDRSSVQLYGALAIGGILFLNLLAFGLRTVLGLAYGIAGIVTLAAGLISVAGAVVRTTRSFSISRLLQALALGMYLPATAAFYIAFRFIEYGDPQHDIAVAIEQHAHWALYMLFALALMADDGKNGESGPRGSGSGQYGYDYQAMQGGFGGQTPYSGQDNYGGGGDGDGADVGPGLYSGSGPTGAGGGDDGTGGPGFNPPG